MESFHSRQSSKVMAGILAVFWIVVLYLVLNVTRIDPDQQMAQKIFYYHVPSAWVAGLGYFVFSDLSCLSLLKPPCALSHYCTATHP